ncbi:craniofacial development protein 2-like, partial [Aphis craccivora]
VNNPTSENTNVKKPQNKPRIWKRTEQRLESENCIKIGTWNIRTLNKPGALQCMLDTTQNYNIAILALQEVRWPGEGNIKKDDKTIFYSGNRNGKYENGVGFAVSEPILTHVKTFQAINERICYIRLTGHIFDIVIINCYAPTEEKGEDIKESFYSMGLILNYCVKIVLGDLNAKVGREEIYQPTIGRESLYDKSNDNGTRLINFCMTNGLTLSSTYFPRKDIYKQTWIAPNRGVKNQIDHIIIQNKQKGYKQNLRSYRGADADSDHYLVIARFALRLSEKRRTTNIKSSKKYSIEKLREEQIHEFYRQTTHDEILKLITESNEENIEHTWKNIQT